MSLKIFHSFCLKYYVLSLLNNSQFEFSNFNPDCKTSQLNMYAHKIIRRYVLINVENEVVTEFNSSQLRSDWSVRDSNPYILSVEMRQCLSAQT